MAAGHANPSSLHAEGLVARAKLETARKQIADFLNARPSEIIFTSGGTESNNLAVFGLARRSSGEGGPHFVTTKLEHASVLEPAKKLNTSYVETDADGFVDLKSLRDALRPETTLASIIYAHNETGTIQHAAEIAKVVRQFRKQNNSATPYLHFDACQATRYLDLNVARLGVDLLTINGAKIGVLGVGVLYVKAGTPLESIMLGGGQERGLRSGTENVPAIAAFGAALEKIAREREKVTANMIKLRDYFIKQLLKFPGTKLNGHPAERLPNNINVTFADIEAEQLVLELDAKGIAVSSGSACATNLDSSAIMNGVRFSLAPETTKVDLDYVLKVLPPILDRLRKFK